MRILVISNDVTPGFGVPVAAPGLRAAGLAEGLRAHGCEVSVSVPSGVIDALFTTGRPTPPPGVSIVDPRELMDHIRDGAFETVVFTNANMSPHLDAIPGVRFVFDMFAPKLLETLASDTATRSWTEMAVEKERALALADAVWVNGRRKLGYALGWLLRPSVDQLRTATFAKPSLVGAELLSTVTVVEMPVPLPPDVDNQPARAVSSSPNIGIAGYSQRWSALRHVHPVHQLLADTATLHALLPAHWGGRAEDAPANQLPPQTISHDGPLRYGDFARWVQSMDAMVDVFVPSAERHFAMVTRTAVALRLGVPVLHGVDSEVADIIRECDAGWVIDPEDLDGWRRAIDALSDPDTMTQKRLGARRASELRFAPKAALAAAASTLDGCGNAT